MQSSNHRRLSCVPASSSPRATQLLQVIRNSNVKSILIIEDVLLAENKAMAQKQKNTWSFYSERIYFLRPLRAFRTFKEEPKSWANCLFAAMECHASCKRRHGNRPITEISNMTNILRVTGWLRKVSLLPSFHTVPAVWFNPPLVRQDVSGQTGQHCPGTVETGILVKDIT